MIANVSLQQRFPLVFFNDLTLVHPHTTSAIAHFIMALHYSFGKSAH